MKKIFTLVLKNRVYFLIGLILVGGGGYYSYKKWFVSSATTRYITAQVERGVLTSSISGTGQVSVSNQVDLKTKAAGDVLYVNGKVGDEVKAGTLLVSLNAREALKSVRDAQSSLDSAKLSLEKILKPVDELTILQAENSLTSAQESKAKSENDLVKYYDDGFNTVANVFLDLPTIMNGLENLLYGNDFGSVTGQSNLDWYTNQGVVANYDSYDKIMSYRGDVNNSYNLARQSYGINFNSYKSANRLSSTSTIEELITETYNTVKLMAEAVKDASNFIDFTRDLVESYGSGRSLPSTVTTHQTSLNTYTGQTNSHLTSLLSIKNSIETAKSSIVSAGRTIAEKTASLADTKAGTDPLDIESQRLSVKQKENALLDAKEKLADYSVRAPFDGVIASFTPKKGDSLSSGASVGTLITKQKIATIALNEIDIARVKVGQKVNLTFDAVDDLNITGEVVEMDTLGTVSQGVVSYNVKIAFDVQDERVKPGMSVSASIILSSKPDVLLVSNSAVKTQGNASYVEILVNGAPQRKDVVVGESNDTLTEVVSGLTEGEEVITQKITVTAGTSAATTAASTAANRQGAQGANAFRMMRLD